MPGAEWITRAELARRAQTSRAAVTLAIDRGRLRSAMVKSKLRADHPEVTRFIEAGLATARRVQQGALRPGLSGESRQISVDINERPDPEVIDDTMGKLPAEIRALAELSLVEIVSIFGTSTALKDYVAAVHKMEQVHERRLKAAQVEGTFVHRDLVQHGVLDIIESAHKKLLTDGAKEIARFVYAMASSGNSEQECEQYVVDRISAFLKNVKRDCEKTITNAKLK